MSRRRWFRINNLYVSKVAGKHCSPLMRALLRISWRHPSKRRPVAGAFSSVTDGHPGSWGALRSGARGSTMFMGLTPWLSPCRVAAGFECSSYGTEHRCSWLDPISCSLRLRYAAQFWTVDSLWLAYESSSTVLRSRRAIEDKVCAGVLVFDACRAHLRCAHRLG
jgi:hypothetical protein